MPAHYYNEFEPYAAQWIRNLIAKGLLAPGEVDERSIVDVAGDDLKGFAQCHFFAGIAGWGLAARLAGWPDDRELWTGSPPCQPFSVAGRQLGQADERHLWPHYFRLIEARRPAVCMGEQVAAAVGKDWLDGVLADLEGIGYAGRAVVVPACAVNAPHRRDRLWFVAEREGSVGDSERTRLEGHAGNGDDARGRPQSDRPVAPASCGGRCESDVADTGRRSVECRRGPGEAHGEAEAAEREAQQRERGGPDDWDGRASSWHDAHWIFGHDGKARRVEPSIRLLAHGVSNRVGRLRAYGNAIVPQVAAEVIAAYMECRP